MVIDFFGVIGEDGLNICYEFEDGVVIWIIFGLNNGSWDEVNWEVYLDGFIVSGCINYNFNQL